MGSSTEPTTAALPTSVPRLLTLPTHSPAAHPCRVFADARRAAEAAHLSGGPARPPSRRSSLDAAAAGGGGGKKGRRRRRQGPLQRVAEQHRADGCESDGGSSSGDDALHSTYAAMARRLRGGAGAGAGGRAAKARWAGRLALLAGLRVAAVVLAARR